MTRLVFLAPAVAQLLLVTIGLAIAAVRPPLHGALLAVPLTGATQGELIDLAMANGATIDGRGVLPGSLVVRGDRARLSAPMRAHGVLLLAGVPGLCHA